MRLSTIDPIPFPGFHDAFAPRPKSASKDKGKGRSAVPGTPLMPQALRPASQLALAGSFETSDLAAPSNALNPDDAANELPDAIADTVEDVQFAPSFEWSREASVFGSLKISTFGLSSGHRSCFGLCSRALRQRGPHQSHV